MRRHALDTALLDERPAISGIALLSAIVAEGLLMLCILLVMTLFGSESQPAEQAQRDKAERSVVAASNSLSPAQLAEYRSE